MNTKMPQTKMLVEKNKSALLSATLGDNKTIIKECGRDIKTLNLLLKRAKNVGEKQNLLTGIGILKGYRQHMKRLQIVGKGLYADGKKIKWEDAQSAFRNRLQNGFIINLRHKDPIHFLDDCKLLFIKKIKNALTKTESIKVNTVFCGEFIIKKNNQELKELKYFTTKNSSVFKDTNLSSWYTENVKDKILTKLEEFHENGSGGALTSIVNLQVNINQFTPQVGSSYIALPPQIASKKACINVKNEDNACFAWSVVSALYPVRDNPQRTSNYPIPSKVLNLGGIQFPMTLRQIPRFEKQNGISINIYILKKKRKNFMTLPVYLTKDEQIRHVNILMVQSYYDEKEDEENQQHDEPLKYHFVWIKDLSRLVSTQLNSHNGKKVFCNRCLHYFQSETNLGLHREDCLNMNNCKVRLPSGNRTILKFQDHRNKIRAPFVIYADVECLLEPTNEKNKYQNHKPCSVGFYVKCFYDDNLSFYKSYRGEDDPIKWFVKELNQFAEDLETVFLCPLPITLTPLDELLFQASNTCHICEKSFAVGAKRVRDHDHITGLYRGVAHESCNINYKDSHVVPVILHNLSGYDSHFIIKSLACDFPGRVDLLPINKERYISFTKHVEENLIKFRFVDSFRFLNASLDKLASYLNEFPILQKEFSDLNEECIELLKRKGVYPYDYFTGFQKFMEEKLPNKNEFYNKLSEEAIADEDYEHAQNVWNKFKVRNLGEYSDLYLKTDVILLAEVFEQFRDSAVQTYGLDPARYFTLPGYTWSCMLKHTDIELELLGDIDMIMFIERGIRGGLSQCMKRHARANNKYCTDFDSSKPQRYLMYNDLNNQYGWSMTQKLPYGGFRWLSEVEVQRFNVRDIEDDSPNGYILEVDLEYSQDLHDLHSDLPLCPEHCSAPGSKQRKLMATLYNKIKYVIHYRNLKQALKYGLTLTKVHRIIEFKQSAWLKSYIDLNTELRKNAKNEFEKNLFKLMNNAVFGKTMENIRKRVNVKLLTQWEGRYGAGALIASPRFKSATIFNENLISVEINKLEVYFNKPIYVGMAILDISKTKLYEFHYEYMKRVYGSKCTALYTDTDSIIYEVECDDLYEIIRRDCYEYFDTSDYAPENQFRIPQVNKKVLGLMKDEMNGKILLEFVGLRSKMYATKVEDSKVKEDVVKKIKGVKKNVVNTQITFEDYLQCLYNQQVSIINQNIIKSEKHNVSTVSQRKVALSPYDDKRYLIANDVITLPWGHYSINESNM